ncbi:hypothetical protein HLI_04650 [Halobacillus litoralis]|uniref:Uncharacterized protein n=1 Tax=Halobacillus litoralis TaxID=45668 RepID=A0A410MA62_9BACI|nr:hypothetical protein HLI_04650 [Halobacillus litoralis]
MIHRTPMHKAESQAKQQKKRHLGPRRLCDRRRFPSTRPRNRRTPPPSYNGELPYAPDGPDRDCREFSSQEEAQAFYEAAADLMPIPIVLMVVITMEASARAYKLIVYLQWITEI